MFKAGSIVIKCFICIIFIIYCIFIFVYIACIKISCKRFSIFQKYLRRIKDNGILLGLDSEAWTRNSKSRKSIFCICAILYCCVCISVAFLILCRWVRQIKKNWESLFIPLATSTVPIDLSDQIGIWLHQHFSCMLFIFIA